MAYTRIKLRGDTSTNWGSNNPILADRELGLETDTKKFKVGDGIKAWNILDYFNEYNIPKDLSDQIIEDTKELARLKTLINDEINDVYSYRGSSAPVLPANKKAYYLSFFSLIDANQTVLLLGGLPNGTIVSVDNTDATKAIKIAPNLGELINGNSIVSLSLAANSMLFLVKGTNGWQIAYQGLLLKDLGQLVDTIKTNIPSTGTILTMDEIKTALKDRLHLFSEIQTEFTDQLHTLVDIQTYIAAQLNDKLHTFAEIDAHIEGAQGFTGAEIKAKLEALTADNRLDANAIKNIPQGITTFTGLNDTPNSYVGGGGKVVSVKDDASGLEFIPKPTLPTPKEVAAGLNSLTGADRLDAVAIKNLPAGVDISGKADLDLSNVSASTMLKKGEDSGLLQQDLADVDLIKLAEKVIDSKVLDTTRTEIERLKTDISASQLPTFSYRGTKVPDYKGLQYKAYYINITDLGDNLMTFNIPAGDAIGTIFTLRNADKENDLTLTVPVGTTLNGRSDSYKIDEAELYMMVKNSATNWITIYNGVLPNSVKNLMDIVKSNLTGQLNTIPEIQAQLKDRLHLFNEIQTEFNDELHSFDAIEADMINRGFSKGSSVGYGFIDSTEPSQSLNWVTAFIAPNAEVVIPAINQGMKYLAINMPVYLAALVSAVEVNQVAKKFTERKITYNELDYTVFIVETQLNTGVTNRLNIEFHNQSAIGKINIADYYAEIGAHFDSDMHTLEQLEQSRFLRDWIPFGTSNSGAVPSEGDEGWVFSNMRLAGTGQITKLLTQPEYIIVKLPKMYDLLVTGIRLNGTLNLFNRIERTESGASYVYYVSKGVSEVSNANITFDLFNNVQATPPSLSVGDGLTKFSNINDVEFKNSVITQQVSGDKKVSVTPYISVQGTNDTIPKIQTIKFPKGIVDMDAVDSTIAEISPKIGVSVRGGQEKLIDSLEIEYPLRFTFNESEQKGELSLEDVFDFNKPEGMFLKGRAITYLKDFDGSVYHADIEHFTKEVYQGIDLELTGDEIQIKRPVGIYTGYPKAPLVCYGRMAFEGFAPKAGFIEIGLRDVATKATILGSYGEAISRTRSYLANEKLYYLDFFSVYEVDYNIKNVELYIKHNFGQDYDLKVSDDVDGGTCLMMQFVSQEYKTGAALDEVRGQYNIILPFEIFELVADQPLAGYSLELNGVIPRTGITGVFNRQGFSEIGTAGKEAFFEMNPTGLNITAKDDSTPSYAYISLMLNAELTQVFKNDNLILTVNLTLKDVFSAIDIIPITWTGIANEIPKGIVGSVPDNFIPVPTDSNWVFDNANAHFIQMDLSDFNPRIISVDFAVPQSAVNFGVLVVPHAVANAMKLHIQGLNFVPKVTDVAPMLKPIVRLGDSYLFSSVRHGQYTWDFPPTTSTDKIQGLALGTNPTQIPVSKRVYGDAAIKLIKINGLNYHVMEFASAGKAKIDSTWNLTRPKSHFVHPSHTAKVYFALATDNGSGGYNLSKITQSEASHDIDVEYPASVQVVTPTFTYDVVAGTILVAMGTCESSDDVYVSMSGSNKPITVDVEYTESVSGSGGSSDEPINTLYTEDELGGVWEIKTAADGHMESLKLDDLPENTVHHITRNNLNLTDFTINDGTISINNDIPELDLSNATFVNKNMLIATFNFTNNLSAIVIPMVIPPNVLPLVLTIHYENGDFIQEGSQNYLYDKVRKEFRFGIGVTGKNGHIVMGFIKTDII